MITIKTVARTCEASPAQWDAVTVDNRQVYVRYRWGHLSVRVAPNPGDSDAYAGVNGDEIVGLTYGDPFNGHIAYDDLKRLTAGVIEWPERETPERIAEYDRRSDVGYSQKASPVRTDEAPPE